MTQRSKGGGVMVEDDKFVAERRSHGHSAVGVLEAELAHYLSMSGTSTTDFYNSFKTPEKRLVQFWGQLESFENLCPMLSKSTLRHVGELLTRIIQQRVSELEKHRRISETSAKKNDPDKIKAHINTLAGFIIARKLVAYTFRKEKGERGIKYPLNADFNRLAQAGALRDPMSIYEFLITNHATHRKVLTYQELKDNLGLLDQELWGADFTRTRPSTRRNSADDERTSSYSDDRLNKAVHVFERMPVPTNKTKKRINKERREKEEEKAAEAAARRALAARLTGTMSLGKKPRYY